VNGELTVLAYISTGSSIRSVLMCTLGFEPSTNNCFHVYIVYYANVALRFGVPAVPFVFPTFATCLCEHASRCCCACTRACIRRDAVGKGQRGQGSLYLSHAAWEGREGQELCASALHNPHVLPEKISRNSKGKSPNLLHLHPPAWKFHHRRLMVNTTIFYQFIHQSITLLFATLLNWN
jgi:hypothetical protein